MPRKPEPRKPCEGCGGEKGEGAGRIYCPACLEVKPALLREAFLAGLRKPCHGCGGPKGPGPRGRQLCDKCQRGKRERKKARDLEAKRAKRATAQGRQQAAEVSRRYRQRLNEPPPVVEMPWSDSASAPKPLPSRQLGLKIQEVIDRADAMCAVNDPLSRSKGNGSMKDICEGLELHERQLLAWKNGDQPGVGFDKADRVLQNAGWFWWDVWTEETVRTAPLTVRLRTLTKRGRWSKAVRTVTYGDPGFRPDWELLARIEHDFTCTGCPECDKRCVRTLPDSELVAA